MNDALLSQRFVLIGLGGLGCPALMSLLVGGARRFLLIDADTVDVSNLQRQVLFSMADRGRNKVAVAADWIRSRRRDVEIKTLPRRFDESAARDCLRDSDIVLECTDSPELKFFVNDHCVSHGITCVIGGALGWSGHIFSHRPGDACLRCIFEAPPPRALAPACADAGVAGSTTGWFGSQMAAYAIHLALGKTPKHSFQSFDLKTLRAQSITVKHRQNCPTCTTSPAQVATRDAGGTDTDAQRKQRRLTPNRPFGETPKLSGHFP